MWTKLTWEAIVMEQTPQSPFIKHVEPCFTVLSRFDLEPRPGRKNWDIFRCILGTSPYTQITIQRNRTKLVHNEGHHVLEECQCWGNTHWNKKMASLPPFLANHWTMWHKHVHFIYHIEPARGDPTFLLRKLIFRRGLVTSSQSSRIWCHALCSI